MCLACDLRADQNDGHYKHKCNAGRKQHRQKQVVLPRRPPALGSPVKRPKGDGEDRGPCKGGQKRFQREDAKQNEADGQDDPGSHLATLALVYGFVRLVRQLDGIIGHEQNFQQTRGIRADQSRPTRTFDQKARSLTRRLAGCRANSARHRPGMILGWWRRHVAVVMMVVPMMVVMWRRRRRRFMIARRWRTRTFSRRCGLRPGKRRRHCELQPQGCEKRTLP